MEKKKSRTKSSKVSHSAKRRTRDERTRPEEVVEVHHHYYYKPKRHRAERSAKPTIAGGLLIINGIIQIVFCIFLIIAGTYVAGFGEGIPFTDEGDIGDISGTVTLVNGTPVENVTISIVGEPIETQTDSDGNYLLFNVPSGKQKVKVEKEGYNTIIYKAFIGSSEFDMDDEDHDNEYNFVLTPGDREIERGSYPPLEWIGSFLYVCAGAVIVIAIFQFIGGYYAIKRKHFGFTIFCAVIGIFAILSIIALFILILSSKEFKKSDEQEHEHDNYRDHNHNHEYGRMDRGRY